MALGFSSYKHLRWVVIPCACVSLCLWRVAYASALAFLYCPSSTQSNGQEEGGRMEAEKEQGGGPRHGHCMHMGWEAGSESGGPLGCE